MRIAAAVACHGLATSCHVAAPRSGESKKIRGRTQPENAPRRMPHNVNGVLPSSVEVASCCRCSAVTTAITHDGRMAHATHPWPRTGCGARVFQAKQSSDRSWYLYWCTNPTSAGHRKNTSGVKNSKRIGQSYSARRDLSKSDEIFFTRQMSSLAHPRVDLSALCAPPRHVPPTSFEHAFAHIACGDHCALAAHERRPHSHTMATCHLHTGSMAVVCEERKGEAILRAARAGAGTRR